MKSAVLSIAHDGDGSPVLFSTMSNKDTGYWVHFYEGRETGTPIYDSPPTDTGWTFAPYISSFWSEVHSSLSGIEYLSKPYFVNGYQTVLGEYLEFVWHSFNLTGCDAVIASFQQAYYLTGKGSGARFIVSIPTYGVLDFYNAPAGEDVWF